MNGLTNFKNHDDFVDLIVSMGFKPFGPSHSSRNGYELLLPSHPKKRFCFYDNRLWQDYRIEFTVMSYERSHKYVKFLGPFYTMVDDGPKYQVFTVYLPNTSIINKDLVLHLIMSGENA